MSLVTTTGNSQFRAFTASSNAIVIGQRVKVGTDGLIDVASTTDKCIGTAAQDIAASGTGTVVLFEPTRIMRASAAISIGTSLGTTTSGNVNGSGAASLGYLTLTQTSASGDFCEAAKFWVT